MKSMAKVQAHASPHLHECYPIRMKGKHFRSQRPRLQAQIGHWIADVVSSMNGGDEADPAVVAGVAAQVRELTNRFPIYG